MKVEYDYSEMHWRNMQKQIQEELDARTDAEKAEDERKKEESLDWLHRTMEKTQERALKTVRILDAEMLYQFQKTVEILKKNAEFHCDRMVYEIKDDQSFGYIKYYTYGIIHVGDEQGDLSRHMWAEIFSTFDGISITAEDDLLCVYIPAYLTKPLATEEDN